MERPELPIYIDSTMTATLRSCGKKHYWNYIRNKVPLGENIHFIAGGAFAAALDAARQFQFLQGGAKVPHDVLLEEILPTFLRAWGEYQAPESHAKNIHNVWCAIEQYLQRYHPWDDPVKPLVVGDRLATEFSFAIPLPINHPSGEPFLYTGKFDVLGDYGGRITVLDDKTTGYFTPHWEKLWVMRGQFIGYVWACQQMGYVTEDCVVRGTSIQKTSIQFLDCPLTFSKHVIDRWYDELLNTLERLKYFYEHDYWPYDFADACSSYGGCQYIDLCTAKDPEKWMNNYQDRTWSPISLEDLG